MLRPSAIVLSVAMMAVVLDAQAVSAQANPGRSTKSVNARTAPPPSKSTPPQRPASGERNWVDRASESNSGAGGGGGM